MDSKLWAPRAPDDLDVPEIPVRRIRLTPLPSSQASGPQRPRVEPGGGAGRRYEELDGAEGREVFFRPERHSAADLAPLRCEVVVFVDGAEQVYALRDVSQNGAAFGAPRGATFAPQQRIEVALRFDAHEAFRGEALVGSVREQDHVTVVGISFNDCVLDVEELLQLRTVQQWKERGPSLSAPSRWARDGHERHRSLVAELRLFFEDSRRQLDALEARLPWHVLHGGENLARAALVSRLGEEFVADALRLLHDVDAAVREVPEAYDSAAAREWSRRHVDEFLMESPACHRARHKPFGYPGDYELMNFMYGDHFVGATLFGRAVQLTFNQTRAARAVCARKDLVKRELETLIASRAGSRTPVRVLSIAAGPAQELVELLDGAGPLPAPVEVVVFEQDKNALAHAWRRLQPCAGAPGPGVRLTFLHDSVKRLLRDGALFAPFGSFDLIYSCGLYDYLQHRTAVILTRHLARALAPGGRLLLANIVDHATRWVMEFHLEWTLVYRTHADLLRVGEDAVPGARLRILEEETRTNPFLELLRP
jgi:extracellular factor (EF) 3-hydroxypalmitic acid methyl ester biosynthesis protein